MKCGEGQEIKAMLECDLFTVSIQIIAPKHFSECCQKWTFLVTMNVFVV